MKRIGHIYCPTGEWTHASTPTVQHLGADTYRIFYSSRDRANRSHIFSLEIDMREPTKPKNIRGPLYSPGRKGTFDADGCSVACVYGRKLYYLGWSLGKNVPFNNAIGSCLVNDNGDLERISEAPIVGRSEFDPISIAYPWVCGDTMLYSSNLDWGETKDDMCYVLRLRRGKENKVCLRPLPGQRAIVRPWGMYMGGDWCVWFAVKTNKYHISYATTDLEDDWNWNQDDAFYGFGDAWASEEVTYPCLFDHAGTRYMLYNGNGYGKTGFGLAVVE